MRKKGEYIPRSWTVADSMEVYGMPSWGTPYFSINSQGNVTVSTPDNEGSRIDIKQLVDGIYKRGLKLPLLLRFSDILEHRINDLTRAFQDAINEYEYDGIYRGVYPIKVNQERRVVEDLLRFGCSHHYGLEAGSKPELLAALASLNDREALIICNGYKDEQYIETSLLSSKMGFNTILVVEKLSELFNIVSVAKKHNIQPKLGIRIKLSTQGSGRWESSGGDHSKFGLIPRELHDAIEYLRNNDLLSGFVLLHSHLGSQISNIRNINEGLRETGRFFCELVNMGIPLQYLDVGGGLGVDYDGSQTNYPWSMNYTLQEYANNVVYIIKEVCEESGVKPPTLVTESGRASVAHHCVLIVKVLGVSQFPNNSFPDNLPESSHSIIRKLNETFLRLSPRNLLESFHDAIQDKDDTLNLFALGHLCLEERALADDIFWAICQKILKITRSMEEIPEELENIERLMADIYFCNFSVFQSLPDVWALNQIFPVMPIQRLDENPSRRAILADITCDSDGKIDNFIDRRDVKHVLELHPFNEEDDYYLGIFLVGAYQEILGDIHNLFGKINTVHVSPSKEGKYTLDQVVEGDSVADVLGYVGYPRNDLLSNIRKSIEERLSEGIISIEESRDFLKIIETLLSDYTYLKT